MKTVWDGRGPLTDSLERDYAAMQGEGWDLIWEPTSPLTTPWHLFMVEPELVHQKEVQWSKREYALRARVDAIRCDIQEHLQRTREFEDKYMALRKKLADRRRR